MSDFSSSNPYNATSSGNYGEVVGDNRIGGFTKFLFIVFIVFGILGVVGGCLGIVQLVAVNAMITALPPAGNVPPVEGPRVVEVEPGPNAEATDAETTEAEVDQEEEAIQPPLGGMGERERAQLEAMMKGAFPGAMALQIAMAIVSTIVSVLMLIGGILGLGGKLSGLNLVRWTSAFMVFYKLLETAVGALIAVKMMGTMKEQMRAGMKELPPDTPLDPDAFFDVMLYIGVGFGIVWGLALAIFYLVTYFHTSKESVRVNFR